MPYEFLEDVATADIAFRAWGGTLEETFIASAEATLNVMVEEIEAVRPKERRDLRVENDELDMLLFNFLQELIYYKDSEKLMLRTPGIRVHQNSKPFVVEAAAVGEVLAPDRHHPRVDVKAVTLHQFRLTRTGKGWEAFVILDI